jgi:hypothetical protein
MYLDQVIENVFGHQHAATGTGLLRSVKQTSAAWTGPAFRAIQCSRTRGRVNALRIAFAQPLAEVNRVLQPERANEIAWRFDA